MAPVDVKYNTILRYPRWLVLGIQSRELIPGVGISRIGNNVDILGKIEQGNAWTS